MGTPSGLDTAILNDFKAESTKLLAELSDVLDRLEEVSDRFPADLLREFSQKIDRIMGAAKTLGLMAPQLTGFGRIGRLAELCKAMGYKAAEKQAPQLVPIFAGFWGDTIEVIGELVKNIEDEAQIGRISGSFSGVLQKRLEWLAGRVAAVRGAAAGGAQQGEGKTGAIDIEAWVRKIGF